MLKGSAMIYAILLSLILSMICTSYILLNHYHNLELNRLNAIKKMHTMCNSAIEGHLAGMPLDELNNLLQELESNRKEISTRTSIKPWGAYEIFYTKAEIRSQKLDRMVLTGAKLDNNYALILADKNKPLSLAGKSRVIGNCLLPRAGVKRAYVEGQNFSGDQLIQGNVSKSNAAVEPLNAELLSRTRKCLQGEWNLEDSVVSYDEVIGYQDSIIHSFHHRTLVLTSSQPINLENLSIRNNIVIHSSSEVIIGNNNSLENIIVYAPSISIERGYKGSIQAFASESLNVEDDVMLNYPSVLGLVVFNPNETGYRLTIAEDAEIHGGVMLHNYLIGDKGKGVIDILPSAVVEGQVYSNDLVSLQGKVNGVVHCNEFTLKTPSSTYGNLLLNAEINRQALPNAFTGISKNGSLHSKSIVKWLI